MTDMQSAVEHDEKFGFTAPRIVDLLPKLELSMTAGQDYDLNPSFMRDSTSL